MADAIYEDVYTPLGYVKGSKGDKGDTGDTGARGAAATISVGSVSTTQYGNPAVVTNSGTANDAVLDFVIPQGQPGEEVTDLSGLTLGTMTTQTAEYPVPQVGDNGATLFGKIAKHFTDLRALINTKLNIANVVNNKTTNQSGYALDARQANPDVSGTLAADVKALNDNLSGVLESESTSLSDEHFSNISLFKRSNAVNLNLQTAISNTSLDTTADYVEYFTIPTGYRPNATIYKRVQCVFATTKSLITVRIASSGVVSLVNHDGVEHPGLAETITYVV